VKHLYRLRVWWQWQTYRRRTARRHARCSECGVRQPMPGAIVCGPCMRRVITELQERERGA